MAISSIKLISRAEAELTLRDPTKPFHSYIVRISKGRIVLSIKFKDGVKHYIIKYTNGFYHIYDIKFRTISDLLQSYSDDWTQLLPSSVSIKDGRDMPPTLPPKSVDKSYFKKFKKFTAKEAEEYLSDKDVFDFVVRPCESYIDCKALTLKTLDGIQHFQIKCTMANCYLTKDRKYPNMDAFIEDYKENNWEKLLNPGPKLLTKLTSVSFMGIGKRTQTLLTLTRPKMQL